MKKIHSTPHRAAMLASILNLEGYTSMWWTHKDAGCVITYAPESVINSCIALVSMGGK